MIYSLQHIILIIYIFYLWSTRTAFVISCGSHIFYTRNEKRNQAAKIHGTLVTAYAKEVSVLVLDIGDQTNENTCNHIIL